MTRPNPVSELRLAITVDDYEAALAFYRDALGLPVAGVWDGEHGRGCALDAGRATLELFDGAGATKRDLVDYLDAVADRIIPELADRPLTVLRVRPGQAPFMQKNVPKYTPSWVRTMPLWAETSKREVSYALCDDRRTLL